MRWLPAFSMMLVSTISYIDRNTLALLAPTILRDAHLSNEQYGFIISAFSIAYMLGNPLWGHVLDRIGVRAGMTAAVSLWTLASVSHVFAFGFRGFAIARAVLGFGEGATFPGSLRTVVQTLRPEQRSRGIAVAYSGGSLGAVITPVIITPVAAMWGWRGAFWATGAVGAAWLLLWMVLSKHIDAARPVNRPAAMRRSFQRPARVGFRRGLRDGGFSLRLRALSGGDFSDRSVREVAGRDRERCCGFLRWGGKLDIFSGVGRWIGFRGRCDGSSIIADVSQSPAGADSARFLLWTDARDDVFRDVYHLRIHHWSGGVRDTAIFQAITRESLQDWERGAGRWRSHWRCRGWGDCSICIGMTRRLRWRLCFRWRDARRGPCSADAGSGALGSSREALSDTAYNCI
jgi:hypothetical protein